MNQQTRMSAILKTESHLKMGFATSARSRSTAKNETATSLSHGNKDGDLLRIWSLHRLAKTEQHQRNTCARRCVCNSAPRAWQTDLRPPTDAGRGHPSPLSLRLPQTSCSCRSDAAVHHAHFHRDKNRIFCFISANIIQGIVGKCPEFMQSQRPVAESHFEYFWVQSRARQRSKDSNWPPCLEKRKVLNRKVMEKKRGADLSQECVYSFYRQKETRAQTWARVTDLYHLWAVRAEINNILWRKVDRWNRKNKKIKSWKKEIQTTGKGCPSVESLYVEIWGNWGRLGVSGAGHVWKKIITVK